MKTLKIYQKPLSVFLIFLFSFSLIYYYGSLGVFPIDSFLVFDSGYRFINGQLPFRDIWTPFGFTLEIIQGIIFYFFGVSWNSYLLHAALFNFLISFATFVILNKLGLKIYLALFYSLLLSVVSYPVPGSPFLDHHSIIFSIFFLYCFILHLKTNNNFYLFFCPILFVLAFLSKQTPATYILIYTTVIGIIFLVNNFSYKKILFICLGLLFSSICFYFFFKINEISLSSFWYQYIKFPLTIGEARINSEFLFPLEFNRIITKYKLIHISLIPMLFSIYFDFKKKSKSLFNNKDFLIKISIIFFSYSLILHQLMTLNQKYIFMIIPLNLGFSHLFLDNKKKYLSSFLVIFCLISVFYYKVSYLDNRKFMELENVNLNNYVDSSNLHPSLSNLKWINSNFSENPKNEIEQLRRISKILANENDNVIVITHYQFFSAVLNKKNLLSFSKTYTYDGISLPKKENKYFQIYKKFVLEKFKKNNINKIYLIDTTLDISVVTDVVGDDCLKTVSKEEILKIYDISLCELND